MILARKIITKREGRGGTFVTDVSMSQICPLDPLSLYRRPYGRSDLKGKEKDHGDEYPNEHPITATD